ncbi:hypothetical protein AB1Y20_012853 [Prymnesium parvum]|uniref:PDZ domain-containing protein n=1 Tax=Prymnesium parvum TaxID=97485 RepID=A0AB34IJ13_PRYPA
MDLTLAARLERQRAKAQSDASDAGGGACDSFRLDTTAASFGVCKCGFPKAAHARAPAAGPPTAPPSSAPPTAKPPASKPSAASPPSKPPPLLPPSAHSSSASPGASPASASPSKPSTAPVSQPLSSSPPSAPPSSSPPSPKPSTTPPPSNTLSSPPPSHLSSPPPSSPPPTACAEYRVDVTAARFGDCTCGFPKRSHAAAPPAARASPRRAPPAEPPLPSAACADYRVDLTAARFGDCNLLPLAPTDTPSAEGSPSLRSSAAQAAAAARAAADAAAALLSLEDEAALARLSAAAATRPARDSLAEMEAAERAAAEAAAALSGLDAEEGLGRVQLGAAALEASSCSLCSSTSMPRVVSLQQRSETVSAWRKKQVEKREAEEKAMTDRVALRKAVEVERQTKVAEDLARSAPRHAGGAESPVWHEIDHLTADPPEPPPPPLLISSAFWRSSKMLLNRGGSKSRLVDSSPVALDGTKAAQRLPPDTETYAAMQKANSALLDALAKERELQEKLTQRQASRQEAESRVAQMIREEEEIAAQLEALRRGATSESAAAPAEPPLAALPSRAAGTHAKRAKSRVPQQALGKLHEAALQVLEVEILRPSDDAPLGISCAPDAAGLGARVCALAEGMVAAKAGTLFVGDVIVSVNGAAVGGPRECEAALQCRGARVAIEVVLSSAAQLALSPPHVMSAILSVRLHLGAKQYLVQWSPSQRRTWATLEELFAAGSAQMWEHFDRSCRCFTASLEPIGGCGVVLAGKVVVDASGAAKAADLQPGDIVISVDQKELPDSELDATLRGATAAVALSVIRPGPKHSNPALQQAEIASEMNVVQSRRETMIEARDTLGRQLVARPSPGEMHLVPVRSSSSSGGGRTSPARLGPPRLRPASCAAGRVGFAAEPN